MTVFHFSDILVWGRLGSSPQFARGVRSKTLVDPETGLPPETLTQGGVEVDFLVADEGGGVTFTASVGVVRADFGAGPETMYSSERLAATMDAAPALAAAEAAQDAVDEVTTGTLGSLILDPTKMPDAYVKLTGNQSIDGLKNFTTAPTVLGVPIGTGGGGVPPTGSGSVALDTDGVPYYSSSGTGTVALDTDGVPYLVFA